MTKKDTRSEKTEDPADQLRRNGLRATKSRSEILVYLQKVNKPVTVEEVSEWVKPHQVTVYRTLQELVKVGLVYQTDFRSGKAYFEYQNQHHHHLVCQSCGTREPVAVCIPVAKLHKVVADSKYFRSLDGHILEFFGTCRGCDR